VYSGLRERLFTDWAYGEETKIELGGMKSPYEDVDYKPGDRISAVKTGLQVSKHSWNQPYFFAGYSAYPTHFDSDMHSETRKRRMKKYQSSPSILQSRSLIVT
jgi:hypothetical protein